MAAIPEKDDTIFMTLREMVIEIRSDVKALGGRVSALERVGFQLKGAWLAISIGCAGLVGTAGVVFGALGYF